MSKAIALTFTLLPIIAAVSLYFLTYIEISSSCGLETQEQCTILEDYQ